MSATFERSGASSHFALTAVSDLSLRQLGEIDRDPPRLLPASSDKYYRRGLQFDFPGPKSATEANFSRPREIICRRGAMRV